MKIEQILRSRNLESPVAQGFRGIKFVRIVGESRLLSALLAYGRFSELFHPKKKSSMPKGKFTKKG